MKTIAAKLISVAVCAAIICGAIVFTRTELHGAVPNPLLYCNDRAWSHEDRLPIEKVLSVYYVPANLFKQLMNVELYQNEIFGNFLIQNGDLWISFDLESGFASLQDRTRMYIKTYEFHGSYYVPVETVCKYLSLTCERTVSPITGETAIRISDGSQQYTFAELLPLKYPGFYIEETTSETSAVTTPPETTATPVTSAQETTAETTEPAPELPDRTIFLTIEDSPGDYTGEILDLLDEFGVKATFFAVGSNAAENPALLSRIIAEGHSIGLHTMNHSSADLKDYAAILADIEAENDLLYRLVKQKSHIWRAPDGSDALNALNAVAEVELNQSGYIVWDCNIDLSSYKTAARAAETGIKGIWEHETPVIRLCENADTVQILRKLLEFISDNSGACDVRTISPVYYEYNSVR